jgi:hypothetical protein
MALPLDSQRSEAEEVCLFRVFALIQASDKRVEVASRNALVKVDSLLHVPSICVEMYQEGRISMM